MQQFVAETIANQAITAFRGKKCWYVSCGGSAGTTFQMALGKRVPRDAILRNEAHSDEYRRFEGEVNLLVWCTWRLDSSARPLSSSDDTTEHVVAALEGLVGQEILDANIKMPAWDLDLSFSGGLFLHLFCDHVPGNPSFDGNWDLFLSDRVISIGVGAECRVEARRPGSAGK